MIVTIMQVFVQVNNIFKNIHLFSLITFHYSCCNTKLFYIFHCSSFQLFFSLLLVYSNPLNTVRDLFTRISLRTRGNQRVNKSTAALLYANCPENKLDSITTSSVSVLDYVKQFFLHNCSQVMDRTLHVHPGRRSARQVCRP